MTGNDVAVQRGLYEPTKYLIRLRRRMERLGFPPHDAVNRLGLDTHYLSCGVGEPGREGQAPPPLL